MKALVLKEQGGPLVLDDVPVPSPGNGEVLLRVHRSYLAALWPLLERGRVRAMAHVTGGGIAGNLPRVLPDGLGARIECGSWTVPNVFRQLGKGGGVALPEMYRVFNMGVGMILVVSPSREAEVLKALGDEAWGVGEVVDGEGVELVGGE